MQFFELLQIATGNRKELSQTPTQEEWRGLFVLAQQQTLVGIAFRGVEQLPETQRPPKTLLMQWYMATERIKAMNVDLDRKALAVANKFLREGFPGMILKGQGIAQLYRVGQIENSKLKIENCHPEGKLNENDDDNEYKCVGEFSIFNSQFSIKEYRTPGDIDIWLHGERKDILSYVRRHVPDCKPVYHHVDFPVIEGVDIEVHFTPSWMNSPFTNRRLQRWFRDERNSNFEVRSSVYSEIPSPSIAFNRVYILVHIYRHLFGDGIGLRQLMDYYFVLQQGFTEKERAETMRTLRSLRMGRFAAAVMWVLQEVFGMDDRYLLTVPNEKEGRFLLGEIMLAGNFGMYDERIKRVGNESEFHTFCRRVSRNFRFVRCYPSEVLWSPLFKLWHWAWRRAN